MLFLIVQIVLLLSPCVRSDGHDYTAIACSNMRYSIEDCYWAKSVDLERFNSFSEASAYTRCTMRFLLLLHYVELNNNDTNATSPHLDLSKIFLEPPGVWGKHIHPVNISIEHSYVEKIYETASDEQMYFEGTFTLTWTDKRLIWKNAACLPRKDISFTENDLVDASMAPLWRPDFHPKAYHDVRWVHTSVNGSTGEVVGTVAIRGKLRCTANYRKYPLDERRCIHFLYPRSQFVQFEAESSDGFSRDIRNINSIPTPPEWTLEKLTENKFSPDKRDYSFRIPPHVILSFTFKRKSPLAFKVSTMLLAVSITLGIFGPLTGSLNGLKVTKSLSVASALVGVGIFALHNKRIYQAVEIPQILVAFEFAVAVSLLSFFLSLIHYQLAKKSEATMLPPSHKVNLVAGVINKFTWWIPRLSTPEAEAERMVDSTEKPSFSKWQEVNTAVHRCSVLVFAFVYVIGTVVALKF